MKIRTPFALVVLTACTIADYQREIARDVSPILHCPAPQITVTEISSSLGRASGCGGDEYFLYFGPNTWTATEDLKQRAAFDIGCPVSELLLSSMGNGEPPQIGVSGCGKRAVYVFARIGYGAAWIMDSASSSTAPARRVDGSPGS